VRTMSKDKCVAWGNSGAVLALLAFAVFAPTRAMPDDLRECVEAKTSFDGLSPLRYVTVLGDKGSRIYLHHIPRAQCLAVDDAECKESTYVVPGDELAIAKICGDWAFAQYIGTEHVSTGWVVSRELLWREEGKIPARESIPQSSNEKKFTFHLRKGLALPVCQTYLQRLNTTAYVAPPYCDHPGKRFCSGVHYLA
jgi:hypothetical protein